jgi:hypothetical protein
MMNFFFKYDRFIWVGRRTSNTHIFLNGPGCATVYKCMYGHAKCANINSNFVELSQFC